MSMEDTYQPSLVEGASRRLVIISGCSGGGKSTLLAELARRGHAVCEEAGRQVVKEQLHIGGDGLPWADAAKFIELTVSRSMHNMISAARTGRTTFFDRASIPLPPPRFPRAALAGDLPQRRRAPPQL
jgi:predicted ATPase